MFQRSQAGKLTRYPRMRQAHLPAASHPPTETPSSRPPARCLVSTREVEEARIAFSRLYTESTLEPIRGLSFECRLEIALHGAISVVTGSWPGGARAAAAVLEDRYVLSYSGGGVAEGESTRGRFAVAPGRRCTLVSPGHRIHLQIGPGFQGRSCTIERPALEAHWRALTGHELRGPILFAADLDLETPAGATVFEVAYAFRREVERPGASPLLLAALHDALLTSLLTNTAHSRSSLLAPAPPRIAPGYVRRAMEYIEAHAAEPLTLADIAAVAGVSVRSLQAAFKTYRGTTPMQCLRDRRVELARQRLMGAEPGTTVKDVVETLGLGEAGRFSGVYRKRFGERPSETLARGARLRAC